MICYKIKYIPGAEHLVVLGGPGAGLGSLGAGGQPGAVAGLGGGGRLLRLFLAGEHGADGLVLKTGSNCCDTYVCVHA